MSDKMVMEVRVMKAVTFNSELRDQSFGVPPEVIGQIPRGQSLQVLVLIPEDGETEAWERLAVSQFGMGYAESDAIYDELSKR